MRPLLAVDGDNLAHRAFHALPSSIRDGDGRQANMIVGFANMLVSVWDAERPRTVFVGFDSVGFPTYRNELLPAYQSGRDFPAELTSQLDRLPELVGAFGFPWAKEAGFEADDFLAAAAHAEEERGGETLVLTNDRDLFQLATPLTTILRPRSGMKDLQRVGPAEVEEIYGIPPALVPDFVALRGDPSDRIPGAKGVGPGRAKGVLERHGSLDAALEAGGFPDEADALRDYLRIARVQHHAPVPDLPDAEPDWAVAGALVESWGLGNLAGRLLARAG
ncbi:MAG TPA: 5'-3' exonuclease H3TH domain-containing protein [Gaiellaceae bacterium]|nr:5'-3' exonuclease H3TH domain-containing protein [Gaiellaceae bacterium]